jgi:cobalt-precorrin 5A hydrolase
MDMGQAMIVAGIGARKEVASNDVLAAIDAAVAAHGLTRGSVSALCSNRAKAADGSISEAARLLGIACRAISDDSLRATSGRTITHTDASIAATGLPSLSEAAALAGAGPEARLLGPRMAVGSVTCALAASGDRA